MIVGTSGNRIVVLDLESGSMVSTRQLDSAFLNSQICNRGYTGIASTPVVDAESSVLYVTIKVSSSFFFFFFFDM